MAESFQMTKTELEMENSCYYCNKLLEYQQRLAHRSYVSFVEMSEDARDVAIQVTQKKKKI